MCKLSIFNYLFNLISLSKKKLNDRKFIEISDKVDGVIDEEQLARIRDARLNHFSYNSPVWKSSKLPPKLPLYSKTSQYQPPSYRPRRPIDIQDWIN